MWMVVDVMMVVAMVVRRRHGGPGEQHRDCYCDNLTHRSVLILSVVASLSIGYRCAGFAASGFGLARPARPQLRLSRNSRALAAGISQWFSVPNSP
jgi:hypothetical protein